MPLEIVTIGDHVKKRRLELGLTQLEVARQLGVEEQTIWYWENQKHPQIYMYPVVFKWLGYNPLPAANTPGEAIRRARLSLGYSKLRLAKLVGTDEPTIRRVELDVVLDPDLIGRIQALLQA